MSDSEESSNEKASNEVAETNANQTISRAKLRKLKKKNRRKESKKRRRSETNPNINSENENQEENKPKKRRKLGKQEANNQSILKESIQNSKKEANSDNLNQNTLDNLDTDQNIKYSYPVDDADHCETSTEAYSDIAPILHKIALLLGKDRSTVKIYDPYFCEGSVIEKLNGLGFGCVYNRMEDFYEVQKQNKVPEYDILITNPPYSEEHVPRLLTFCVNSNKPFFLLLPNWVYNKDYYSQIFQNANIRYPSSDQLSPFYLVPSHRYFYWTPKGRRQKKSKDKTSPFFSFWYIYFGQSNDRIINWWRKKFTGTTKFNPTLQGQHQVVQEDEKNEKEIPDFGGYDGPLPLLARTLDELPISALDQNDIRAKRIKNMQKREKYLARKRGQQGEYKK